MSNIIISVTGFEFTADREVFDLMNVQLVHGWVVENQIEAEALGSFSYNQAIDYILSFPDTEKAVIIKDFFQKSASQLTEKGLTSLRNYLTNGQLAIFFRNNHFSTIIKFGFEIYALATDVAFTEVDEVVWECISGVSGNNFYSDSNFIPINSNNRGQESNELYQTIELEKFENEDYIMNQILIISQAEGNIVEKNRLENEKQEKQEKEKEKKREKMEKEKQEKGKKRNDERVNADADVNSDISLVIVKKKEGNKKIKKCTCEIW